MRTLSTCFCCLGGMNDDVLIPQINFEHSIPHEADVCQFNSISLLKDPLLFQPLLLEKQFVEAFRSLIDRNPLIAAAAQGDFGMVKSLFRESLQTECFFDEETVSLACVCAASNGHLKILKFLLFKVFPANGWWWNTPMLRGACICASAQGHKNVLKFLFGKVLPESPHVMDWDLLTGCSICASAGGHLSTLKFLFSDAFPEAVLLIDFPVLNSCSVAAACKGQLSVLEYLFFKAIPQVSFTIEPETFRSCFICAATNNQPDVLRFLMKLSRSENYWYLSEVIDCRQQAFFESDFGFPMQ